MIPLKFTFLHKKFTIIFISLFISIITFSTLAIFPIASIQQMEGFRSSGERLTTPTLVADIHSCTFSKVVKRPSKTVLNQVFKSVYFCIHYTENAPHRPVSPTVTTDEIAQWLQQLINYLENAYQLLVEERGFKAPPTDGTIGGGENLYDVYVKKLKGEI